MEENSQQYPRDIGRWTELSTYGYTRVKKNYLRHYKKKCLMKSCMEKEYDCRGERIWLKCLTDSCLSYKVLRVIQHQVCLYVIYASWSDSCSVVGMEMYGETITMAAVLGTESDAEVIV